jgi:hypothetical protein
MFTYKQQMAICTALIALCWPAAQDFSGHCCAVQAKA